MTQGLVIRFDVESSGSDLQRIKSAILVSPNPSKSYDRTLIPQDSLTNFKYAIKKVFI